jgi:hypothetical protein
MQHAAHERKIRHPTRLWNAIKQRLRELLAGYGEPPCENRCPHRNGIEWVKRTRKGAFGRGRESGEGRRATVPLFRL